MQINVRTRNLQDEAGSATDYATEKLGMLSHYLPELREADVELFRDPSGREGNSCVAEALLKANGHVFRASSTGSGMNEVTDLLHDKLKIQIGRYHEKSRSHRSKDSTPKDLGTE